MIRAFTIGLIFAVICLPQVSIADSVFDHPGNETSLTKLLADSTRPLQQAQTLRGTFVQQKILREIPRPLISSGSFVFVRDEGIYWHTQSPLDSEFILTGAGMTQSDSGGQAVRVSSEQQPGLKVAASIFFAMFAIDLNTLQENFDLFGKGQPDHWEVGLRPKGAMAAVFREATISGGRNITGVLIHDVSGDSTEISLHNLQVSKEAPSIEESDRLGFTHR